ncbi:glycosyltransferase family 2 protein [filamentous cyanobacterium LEGE 11480]|uniref:Glycosyltransferase family 2 protein n=1 Tax=Romeriopsis navalis LEGE 11480 TaxID=2777977 RepID=A0A928VLA6_9CYAN|nr:glycosyltransferase family A protein [Romeriopsis navalis]MBE9028462.1 glycosyltransferase family 2 protein [Romeriopsis navalis LEGE 11480]
MPKVSVVIPAYNVRDYLTAALESLILQTYHDFEALIVDDGSTDDTAAIAEQFVKRDSRFQLLQKPNGGLSSARNFGINYSNSEYIALLDGDDVYLPHKLAAHVATLEANPAVGIVYGASQAMRDDGTPTWLKISGKPVHPDPLPALMCKNFIVHGSNAMLRRLVFDEVGQFDEALPSVEDLDLWLRIASAQTWQFHRDRRILSYYRVRPSGLSFNLAQMQQTHEQVLQMAQQRSPAATAMIMPTARAYMYRYLGRMAVTMGNADQANQFLDQAWQQDWRIFGQDPKSLVTLLSIKLAPVAQFAIRRALGTAR